MTIQDLAKQDPREVFPVDARELQELLAEVMEDDSIPYNVEGEDQDERERIKIEGQDQDD